MLPHTLITASAGSGKTWSLTVRYLRLLMLGAEPESIVALTFSRKAAGEFFNAILHRLAEAASRSDLAERLAADIERPGTTKEEFCQALVKMTSRLPFLMLGTLDSFFIRMARSFPFELGLNGDFTMLDPHQQAVEQLRVYERVFAPEGGPAVARKEFMHAFTEATHGKDEVNVRRKLDEFIKVWHAWFLTAPHADQWGEGPVIWPVNPPVPGPALDRVAVVERIRQGLRGLNLPEKHQQRWDGFLEAVLEHSPGTPFAPALTYLWNKLLPVASALRQGGADVKLDKTEYHLNGPMAEGLADLLAWIYARELEAVLRQTRGIYEVVLRYDRHYHELVRRQGKLTFHDVQLILGGGLSPEASGSMAQQARALTHGENRQLMDYRLDARYDHWLLDEFQDTSRVQWKVLANLMDEAIQDGEGRKSFFAVGDQKQSIYEWRGGTPQLFEDLQRQYNNASAPEEDRPLKIKPLSLSQRSGPAVIEMVNRLLGNPEALSAVLPAATVAKWPWQEHTSRNTHFGGTALVVEVPDDPTDEAPAYVPEEEAGESEDVPVADARWSRAAELLLEIQPMKRKLTCAVLCHRNPRALAIADFLRARTGMEVVCESDLSIARDNPATSALLALLQAAAHPGDLFAWEQVMMTPLERVMGRMIEVPVDQREANDRKHYLKRYALRQVLVQVTELGFHDTLRWWIAALQKEMPELDSFSLGRMDELCSCARQFDLGGSRDVDEFITFAESWTVRGASHAGAIQVMTVHRSKGLTFDIVIIPDLHDRMFRHGQTVGYELDDEGGVEWLLKLPKKDLTLADPVLGAAMSRADAAGWRERLAGLYVMVTRAKYANYLFLKPPPKTSSTPSLARIVREALTQEDAGEHSIGGKLWSVVAKFGDPEWFQVHELRTPPPAKLPAKTKSPWIHEDLFASPAVSLAAVKRRIPLRAKRPSEVSGGGNGLFFKSASQEAKEAGVAVHEALRRVRWRETAAADLRASGLDPNAGAEALRCAMAPGLTDFFTAPESGAEVWRERSFDVVLDGELHSGIFDRVLVIRDPAGAVERAVLVEFKSGVAASSVADAARLHGRQVAVYRRALARLLGLTEEKIRAVLVFTATQEAVDL